MDKSRKIKPNDYYDIMHSSVALSTCNFFLTEKSFSSTLKRMNIDKEFNITVLSFVECGAQRKVADGWGVPLLVT